MDTAFTIGLSLLAGGAGKGLLDRLREHRRKPLGLADLVGWAFLVDRGTILQKDGSLLVAFRFRGPDLQASTPEQLDALAFHVHEALGGYTDRWLFQFDAIRRPAAGYPSRGAFPDPLLALLDQERRRAHESAGAHFETECFLSVTFATPKEVYSRIESLFVRGRKREVDWHAVVDGFERRVDDLELRLGAVLDLDRLEGDELLTYLHECLTGERHRVRTPPEGAYLDGLLADRDLTGGWTPAIGERAIRAVAIHGFPHSTGAGDLDLLNTLPFAFRASHRFIPLGRQAANRAIRRAQLGWFRSRKGLASWARDVVVSDNKPRSAQSEAMDQLFEDGHAAGMVEDAARAAAENASNEVRFGAYTLTLLAMDQEPKAADGIASEIAKAMQERGFNARVETLNTLEAWLGTLPGNGHANLRRPLVSTQNLADLAPLTSVWPGLAFNPSAFFPPKSPPLLQAATSGATPFRLHLHDSDVGHTLIVGRTGAGKSTLVGLLAAQFLRYERAQVFVFDVGRSAEVLCLAANGRHTDLLADGANAIRLQPLARLDEPNERAWAGEWVEDLLALQGVAIVPAFRSAIDRALALVGGSERKHRTLTELSVQLQSRLLKDALRPYTLEGPFGALLDAYTDDLAEGPFQVFELKALLDLDEKILLPVLTYLFHRVEQRLDGSPSLLVIEEAWLPLLHSHFASRIRQWLLTLRKQNAAVVLVTQSLAQLAQSPHRSVILESCPTRLLLPNPDAAHGETATLYRELGLNPTEIELLARARPKRDYYFMSPRGRRRFELGLGPAALAFLSAIEGKTLQKTQRLAREMRERCGSNWPAAWLRDLDLATEADLYESLAQESSQGDGHEHAE